MKRARIEDLLPKQRGQEGRTRWDESEAAIAEAMLGAEADWEARHEDIVCGGFSYVECTFHTSPRREVFLASSNDGDQLLGITVNLADLARGITGAKLHGTFVATRIGPTLVLELEGALPKETLIEVTVAGRLGQPTDIRTIGDDSPALISLEESKGVGDVIVLGVRRAK